jgi:hypothetical protein
MIGVPRHVKNEVLYTRSMFLIQKGKVERLAVR